MIFNASILKIRLFSRRVNSFASILQLVEDLQLDLTSNDKPAKFRENNTVHTGSKQNIVVSILASIFSIITEFW